MRSTGGQVFVNELHRHRPSPTAEATRLVEPSRTSPCGEDAGTAGLEQERLPVGGPVRRG